MSAWGDAPIRIFQLAWSGLGQPTWAWECTHCHRDVEDAVMVAIAERFNLASPVMPAAVKEADARILLDERAAMLRTPPTAWDVEGLEPLGVQIIGMTPPVAEQAYRGRLEQLLTEADHG